MQKRILDEPLIEPRAANGQRRHINIHVAREHEDVDGGMTAGETGRQRAEFQRRFAGKIQFVRKIDFPAMSNGKKFWHLPMNGGDGALKVLQKNNVAIDVAEQRSLRGCPGALQQVAEQRSAKSLL